jgi:3',5'-cyclic-AMP phosphodiesterase
LNYVARSHVTVRVRVAASDLQGVVGHRLLGEALVDELASHVACDRTGVVLAGDLYSAPYADKRGATGDVFSVWKAFEAKFAFVVGVAGNHDIIDARTLDSHVHLLDGAVVEIGGVRFGGVCGVIGESKKHWRRPEREFVRALRACLDRKADVVVLHQGPDAEWGELRGSEAVRVALDVKRHCLVVCGHVHWPTPLAELRGGAQVLNVDGRVVVLST